MSFEMQRAEYLAQFLVAPTDVTQVATLTVKGATLPLRPGTNVIGRAAAEFHGVAIDFPGVSSTHATILIADGFHFIQDLYSTNSTYLSTSESSSQFLLKPRTMYQLLDGNFIWLGPVRCKYSILKNMSQSEDELFVSDSQEIGDSLVSINHDISTVDPNISVDHVNTTVELNHFDRPSLEFIDNTFDLSTDTLKTDVKIDSGKISLLDQKKIEEPKLDESSVDALQDKKDVEPVASNTEYSNPGLNNLLSPNPKSTHISATEENTSTENIPSDKPLEVDRKSHPKKPRKQNSKGKTKVDPEAVYDFPNDPDNFPTRRTVRRTAVTANSKISLVRKNESVPLENTEEIGEALLDPVGVVDSSLKRKLENSDSGNVKLPEPVSEQSIADNNLPLKKRLGIRKTSIKAESTNDSIETHNEYEQVGFAETNNNGAKMDMIKPTEKIVHERVASNDLGDAKLEPPDTLWDDDTIMQKDGNAPAPKRLKKGTRGVQKDANNSCSNNKLEDDEKQVENHPRTSKKSKANEEIKTIPPTKTYGKTRKNNQERDSSQKNEYNFFNLRKVKFATSSPLTSQPLPMTESDYRIMFTGLANDHETYSQSAISLGAICVESWQQSTHLVTDKVRRTVKFLSALSSGKHIVNIKWILDSKKCGFFVNEAKYVVKDKNAEKNYGFSLVNSIKVAKEGKGLMKGLKIFVSESVKPAKAEMNEIIVENIAKDVIVIGSEGDDFKGYSGVVYSAEFILSGVLRQSLNYDLFRL